MKKSVTIPKYIARELERAAYYSRKSQECATFFAGWLEKQPGIADSLDFLETLDEFIKIIRGGDVNVPGLEKAINEIINTD